MLTALELRDFAIVDELRLEPSPGLNALTGETGAGKSLLVDALTLLAGERADTSFIRAGSRTALIQGEFEGVAIASASRRLQQEGRSSARIDGELVNVGELASRLAEVIAIHGQHASQGLTRSDEPRRRLDRLLDEEGRRVVVDYGKAYSEYSSCRRRLEDLREGALARERRRATLAFEIEEITAAGLRPGEEHELQERIRSLRHAERIVQGSAAALEAVAEGERSAVALLSAAVRDLTAAARHHAGLEPLVRELEESRAAVQATAGEIESFLDGFSVSPAQLDELEARLARIEGLERKYGEGSEAILAHRAQAVGELEGLDVEAQSVDELQERVRQERSRVLDLGARLTVSRREAAARLSAEVESLLEGLGMAGAHFGVRLEDLPEPGPYGLERIRFDFAANPGEPGGDLATMASGGELSRVMLALDVVTGSDLPILVFDEVDAGVGGAAARSVGSLLKRLAATHQVLVVTHLPQVAAFADAQFYVDKIAREGRTVTRVHRLQPHEREQELARMLSGSVTEASLRNARELVAESAAI